MRYLLASTESVTDGRAQSESDAADLLEVITPDEFGSVGHLVTLVCRVVFHEGQPSSDSFENAIEEYLFLAEEWFLDRRARWNRGAPSEIEYRFGDVVKSLEAWRLILDIEWLAAAQGSGSLPGRKLIEERAAMGGLLSAVPC